MNYKLTIAYDGERYKGWQRLDDSRPTVQAKIDEVLSRYLGQKTEITGAGRTDAGVHASGQTANFKCGRHFDCGILKESINKYLPEDITIKNVETVSEDFNARFDAKSKTYLYRILKKPNPFMRRYAMRVFMPIDTEAMKKAARYFVGTHDFTAFTNAKSKKKSKVRMVNYINISETEDMIEIEINGNGFLHNMVRRIVGVLIEVGEGRYEPAAAGEILESKDRSRVNTVADACGLFLMSIEY